MLALSLTLSIIFAAALVVVWLNTSVNSFSQPVEEPIVYDSNLKAEVVFNEPYKINNTSNMAFLGQDDILVLDNSRGTVMRITNGTMLPQPLLDVSVNDADGMLGVAVSNHDNSSTYVFLYYTQAPNGYNKDISTADAAQVKLVNDTFGYTRECDCLYRYELVNNQLINPKLLLSLNASSESHHGGEILIGPDNNIYIITGDLDEVIETTAQNFKDGLEADGRAGILRITQDGEPVGGGILGNKPPLNLYYSYGMRNGFGLDFDPITGNLWDTENGPEYGDEINLVLPGFNSGSDRIFGLWSNESDLSETDLVDFGGKGEYSDPELEWNPAVGPTAIKFLNSDKLGKEYENDLFVADVNDGFIYHFDLNENRTALSINGPFVINVTNTHSGYIVSPKNPEPLIFLKEFGSGITDLQVGPDGFLYLLFGNEGGTIYRIVPK